MGFPGSGPSLHLYVQELLCGAFSMKMRIFQRWNLCTLLGHTSSAASHVRNAGALDLVFHIYIWHAVKLNAPVTQVLGHFCDKEGREDCHVLLLLHIPTTYLKPD